MNLLLSHELKEFWELSHLRQDRRFIGGNGNHIITWLHINDIFPKAKTILNIGVGNGDFERICCQAGKVVDSLDIVPEARECIKRVVRHFYLTAKEIEPNIYDLITESYVAQHITDRELESHIKYSIAGLKPNGVYALHSPFCWSLPKSTSDRTFETLRLGHVFRPRKWIEENVLRHGGVICHIYGSAVVVDTLHEIYHIKGRKTG